MVRIPAGRFRMGDVAGIGYANEQPVHEVTVGSFRLGKTEVTRGDFAAFVEATSYRTDAENDAGGKQGCYAYQGGADFGWKEGASWRNPGWPQSDEQPVVCVSANDAQAYIDWLNRETGEGYRLPTEAEWEYAARAGSETRYGFGDHEMGLCRYANVADRTLKHRVDNWPWDIADCLDGYLFAAPVARFQANGFGLHDMHGNVWEWTCSLYEAPYRGGETRCASPADAKARVIRGSSWSGDPRILRSASRSGYAPLERGSLIGFRLAQD